MTGDHRQALTSRRAEAQARLAELQALLERIDEAAEGSNRDDEHDVEGATIGWDRAQTQALASEATQSIADLDAALARLDAGWDGRCRDCGIGIPRERLLARPEADRCVGCAAVSR